MIAREENFGAIFLFQNPHVRIASFGMKMPDVI